MFIATAARIGCLLVAVGLGMAGSVFGQTGAALEGTVTTVRGGTPVAGATVTLFAAGTDYALTGTVTGAAGRYRLAGVAPERYRVEVRAAGFRTVRRRITLAAGATAHLSVALPVASSGPEAVVTTPARRPETVRHAPAAVGVVGADALQRAQATAAVEALRAVPGVHVARMGSGQHGLALRGIDGLFGDAPLVLVDGQPAAVPGLATNLFAVLPLQSMALQRVEVVRGPAVALHGPAARAGVVQIITQDAFEAPGTHVALTGGTGPFGRGRGRHAAVIGHTFGYDIAAHGARAPDSPAAPGRRDGDRWTAGVRGRAVYRLDDKTTIGAQGGYTAVAGQWPSSVGGVQADPLGVAFTRLWMDAGGLRAQVGLTNAQTRTASLDRTGQSLLNRSVAYDAHLRYRFAKPYWATVFTAGAAARWIRPRTGGTLMGRFEEHDGVDRYGAYVYANTTLTTQLDAALALRADVDNASPAVWPTVRAALVYDVTPAHTVQVRYDRLAGAPRAREQFLDMVVRRQTLQAPYHLAYRARGAVEPLTFDQYRTRGTATSLVPGAGRFGQPMRPDAIPLSLLYGGVASDVAAAFTDPATQPAPVRRLTIAQREQFAAVLRDLAGAFARDAITTGVLGIPSGDNGFRQTDAPVDVAPLARPIAQTVEVGYRGVLSDRVQVMAAAHVSRIKHAIRPLALTTPLVYAPALADDLMPALTAVLADAARGPDAPLGPLLDAMGLTPSEAARLVTEQVATTYANKPVGLVAPDQRLMPRGASAAEQVALVTHRNVRRLWRGGIEAGLRVQLGDRWQVTGAGAALHVPPTRSGPAGGQPLTLSAPGLRGYVDARWAMSDAWAVYGAAHYAAGFSVRNGWSGGTVPAGTPVDVGLRYDAERWLPGLQVQVAVQNVLGQTQRGFVGVPPVQRVGRLHLTYAL